MTSEEIRLKQKESNEMVRRSSAGGSLTNVIAAGMIQAIWEVAGQLAYLNESREAEVAQKSS